MDMHRLGLPRAFAKLDQRPDENAFDENEDSRSGVNQNLEQVIDIPIHIRPLMEDAFGVTLLPTSGEKYGQGDRQRDRTRIAGARPAQAGEKRHAVSLYRAF